MNEIIGTNRSSAVDISTGHKNANGSEMSSVNNKNDKILSADDETSTEAGLVLHPEPFGRNGSRSEELHGLSDTSMPQPIIPRNNHQGLPKQ
ncbi:hypothetical protein QTP88_023752 [Uroleucon formosanum]